MLDPDLQRFSRELRGDIEDSIESGEGVVWPEHEFTRQVLERLGEAGVIENPEHLELGGTGRIGRREYRLFGYSVPDDDDPERIALITTIFDEDWTDKAITLTELGQAIEKAAWFVLESFKGLHDRMEPSNTDASDLARRLLNMKELIHTVRIVVLTNRLSPAKASQPVSIGDVHFIADVYGLERLHRVLGRGLIREDIEVDLSSATHPINCLSIPGRTDAFDAYLTSIPGGTVADIYERYGTRILELNVRAFLGLRGKKSVNAGLRETIRESPEEFFAFNNGIVATADEIELTRRPDGLATIKKLTGFQIVNGGQTTASLHRARRVDKASLDGILVPLKIIHVRGANLVEMVRKISRSANSQNSVQPADFSANDPIHVRIEHLANNVWSPDHKTKWFYDRARGAYEAAQDRASASAERTRRFNAECPKDKRFSKLDLAKCVNAWEGYPHLVCLGGQKNFQALMQRMKDQGTTEDKLDERWFRNLVAQLIVFRGALSAVRARKFPAYQANINAYLVSAISLVAERQIDLDLIWRRQSISSELRTMMGDWATTIDALIRETAGARMPTEWTKKEECWELLRQRLPSLPSHPPPELASYHSAAPADGVAVSLANEADDQLESDEVEVSAIDEAQLDDATAIRIVQRIDTPTWNEIAKWGVETRGGEWKLEAVVRTMAECSGEGWKRPPTPRLAKRAMNALSVWRQAVGKVKELS